MSSGEIWEDSKFGHRVGVIDATDAAGVAGLCEERRAHLAIHDPPYNFEIGGTSSSQLSERHVDDYVGFCRTWIENTRAVLAENAFLYVWMGADQRRGFQPLPDFMIMMRSFDELRSRSFLTIRNQRGYGTQKNWMSVRQELLCYQKGEPEFTVCYTDIPKSLKGYYKTVGGERTENLERGKSPTIRPGNVWVDVQQVFYRREENVPGAYAQKPLAAVERIVRAASRPGQQVVDFFSHSGTTLIACERLGRPCAICDIDPVFAEITIRRLEQLRRNGKTGWQWKNPFPEVAESGLQLPLSFE